MFKAIVFLILGLLIGCQSAKEKNMDVIRDRSDKLKPLADFKPTWCRLETHLTQPALARYREMYPEDVEKLNDGVLNYTWKARKYSCEITALEQTPLTKNHQAFLESAICMLLQVHWVNSPFEQLQIYPRDIIAQKDGTIHLQGSMLEPELGVYLDPLTFKMETRTKGRGVLKAVFTENEHDWLPQHLEQLTAKSQLTVDGIEYDAKPTNGRRMIKSLWISVGDAQPYQHTQVDFVGCRSY